VSVRPTLKVVVEELLEDDNVRRDRVLYDLIAGSPHGWIDVDEILGMRKLKAMGVGRRELFKALQSSWLEISQDSDGTGAVRRPPSMPLPGLSSGPSRPMLSQHKLPSQAGLMMRQQGAASARARRPEPPMRSPLAAASGLASQPSRKRQTTEQRAGVEADILSRAPLTSTHESVQPLLLVRHQGVVRSYDESSGDVWIDCAATRDVFQQDVCASWLELESAGLALEPGSQVSFQLHVTQSGTPQAKQLLTSETDSSQRVAPRPTSKPELTAEERPAKRARDAAPTQDVTSRRLIGKIRSVNPRSGIGRIESEEQILRFGKLIAYDSEEHAGFELGEVVSFSVMIDPRFHTPKAVAICRKGEEPQPQPTGGAKKGTRTGATVKKGSAEAPVQRLVGKVDSFEAEEGTGFIACDALISNFGCDLIEVRLEELAGFDVNDTVSFEVFQEQGSGTLWASNIEAEHP